MSNGPLVELASVAKTYPSGSETRAVLGGVDLVIDRRQIVGLVGRSGSGKSTLLRLIAGLESPTAGRIRFAGTAVVGPVADAAMVFQSFALFPWLSVLGNVELGLEARGIERTERRSRALAAIDLVGLDGFENALPRELSGGMRQRVGIARALAVRPRLLLMDEPFSALDVLTAETLRNDLLDLWLEHKLPTEAILLVTHNIEEAVALCDRVVVLASAPGRVAGEVGIALARPRLRDAGFFARVEEIYDLLTRPDSRPGHAVAADFSHPLPPVSPNQITGLLDALAAPDRQGRADLPELAAALNLRIDVLLRAVEVTALLGFARAGEGDAQLTPEGRVYVEADLLRRKEIFAVHLLRHVPLVARIRRVLEERAGHRAPRIRFVAELEDHLPSPDAEATLDTAIGWGRYGELFAYDHRRAEFALAD